MGTLQQRILAYTDVILCTLVGAPCTLLVTRWRSPPEFCAIWFIISSFLFRTLVCNRPPSSSVVSFPVLIVGYSFWGVVVLQICMICYYFFRRSARFRGVIFLLSSWRAHPLCVLSSSSSPLPGSSQLPVIHPCGPHYLLSREVSWSAELTKPWSCIFTKVIAFFAPHVRSYVSIGSSQREKEATLQSIMRMGENEMEANTRKQTRNRMKTWNKLVELRWESTHWPKSWSQEKSI